MLIAGVRGPRGQMWQRLSHWDGDHVLVAKSGFIAEFRGSVARHRRDRSGSRYHLYAGTTQRRRRGRRGSADPNGSSHRTTAIDLTRTRNEGAKHSVWRSRAAVGLRFSAASASSASSAFRRAASPPCEWVRLRCSRLQTIPEIVRRATNLARGRDRLLSTFRIRSTLICP